MTSAYQEQMTLFNETKTGKDSIDIVAVQFQDKYAPERFRGMEYSYFTLVPLTVGDVVIVPTKYGNGVARVSRTGITESEVDNKILPQMLTINQLPTGKRVESERVDAIEGAMFVRLDIKRPSEFFWLAKIRGVNISKCCKQCFYGESESRLYYETIGRQTPKVIELNVMPHKNYVAYYLCGLSKGYNHRLNTHLAFICFPGENLHYETSQVDVVITNARRVEFEQYIPNPLGYFTNEQRKCRNWIFANYLRDGMVEQYS